MADQKKWFKVWTAILSDDDFDPSRDGTLEDTGRWMRLGAYMALHGNNGTVEIMPDTLCKLLGVPNIDTLRCKLMFKNVTFEEGKSVHGKTIVTWRKWYEYQVDSTYKERKKRTRYKRRGEEIRREEIKTGVNKSAKPVLKDSLLLKPRFEKFWSEYPRKINKAASEKIFLKIAPDDELLDKMLKSLNTQKNCEQWQTPKFIPHPSTWLNNQRWNDVLEGSQKPSPTWSG